MSWVWLIEYRVAEKRNTSIAGFIVSILFVFNNFLYRNDWSQSHMIQSEIYETDKLSKHQYRNAFTFYQLQRKGSSDTVLLFFCKYTICSSRERRNWTTERYSLNKVEAMTSRYFSKNALESLTCHCLTSANVTKKWQRTMVAKRLVLAHMWRRSVVVSALASINVVNRHWARLVLGWVTTCGRVNHLGM